MLHKCPFLLVAQFADVTQEYETTLFNVRFEISYLGVFDTFAQRATETLLTVRHLNTGSFRQSLIFHGQQINGFYVAWSDDYKTWKINADRN